MEKVDLFPELFLDDRKTLDERFRWLKIEGVHSFDHDCY